MVVDQPLVAFRAIRTAVPQNRQLIQQTASCQNRNSLTRGVHLVRCQPPSRV